MTSWGTSGTFDPFADVYEVRDACSLSLSLEKEYFGLFCPCQLVFQTTVRSLSCSEIADDATVVSRLKKLYDRLDGGTTPATVLLPWLPLPAMISKLLATKEIYDIVLRAIDAREQSGTSRNDTLQMLLDMGDEKMVIVGVRILVLVLVSRKARQTETCFFHLAVYHGPADRRCSVDGNRR